MKAMSDKEVIGYWANRWRIADEECAVYRAALRKIADGKGDPVTIAWEALGDDEGDDDDTP